MKTLKLQIIATPFIHEVSRVFSSMVRMAYNRYLDGLSETEVRHRVKGCFSVNSWLLQSAVRYASGIYAANGDRKVVFGGRAYKKFEKGWFYPKFNVKRLDERWKQTLAGVKTWKKLAQKIKESGRKYRFLLADCIRNGVFSKSYNRRMYGIFQFP